VREQTKKYLLFSAKTSKRLLRSGNQRVFWKECGI